MLVLPTSVLSSYNIESLAPKPYSLRPVTMVEWVFIETGFHRNEFSSKRVFIEMSFHRMAFSSNEYFNQVFKTVSRISVAPPHPKLLMIW
jgi:hypothetical protein